MAKSLNNLAILLYDKGDYDGAEAMHREALALKRKRLGDENPDVATSLSNLAAMLMEKGDYAGAEASYREVLPIMRKVLGNDHADVGYTLISLAETLCREQKPAEGERLAREGLAIFHKSLLGGHPYIAEADSILGGCLAVAQRYEEAEPLLLGAYPALKAKTGAQSPEAQGARKRIVRLYEAWGKPAKATKYRALLAVP